MSTVTYIGQPMVADLNIPNQTQGNQNRMNRQQPQQEVSMFEPKSNNPLNLICSENPVQEMNYLLNNEYHTMREKQELMDHQQAEDLKAKEQEQKEAAAAAENTNAPDGAPG